jgi:hypothetical protein
VEGPNWVAKEDPPAEYVDALPSTTDNVATPVFDE